MARVYVSPKYRGNATSLEHARSRLEAKGDPDKPPPQTPPAKIRKPARSPPKLKRKPRTCQLA
jgi:hypothetical protein